MNDLTFSEAGLILAWIGNRMYESELSAGAVVDFDMTPEHRNSLIEHLSESIDKDRAIDISENIDLDELTSFDLEF